MKNELKVKVLDALSKSEPTCFTKENVYKCSNDGMVCFNGFVAELINGNKYEIEDYYDVALERNMLNAEEYLLDEVKHELHSWEHWDDLSEEEQTRLIDVHLESAIENYESDVEDEEVSSIIAEEIINDLDQVYQSLGTQDFINQTHYNWISGKIDFDLAMAEVERFIVENE